MQSPLGRGVSIGRYVVLGLVGRGAMGEVYAAHDPELNRKVAIKLIRPSAGQTADDGQDSARLMREAQSIARLSHPNIVVIHDVGSFRNTVFIAMEFVDGHTVGYWMNAQPRTWREVLKIFAAAGRGLVAAHEKELVHRDFKPDNVMLSSDGQVRVMDFGLAQIIGESAQVGGVSLPALAVGTDGSPEDLDSTRWLGVTDTHRAHEDTSRAPLSMIALRDTACMVGTPAYMAPEQFQGKRTDARGDQFSFCVGLYEALYGEGPFQGNTLLERAANVTSGNVREAPPYAGVPQWIRKVILRGLQVNPDQRWPSLQTLLSALDENSSRLADIDEWLAARGTP